MQHRRDLSFREKHDFRQYKPSNSQLHYSLRLLTKQGPYKWNWRTNWSLSNFHSCSRNRHRPITLFTAFFPSINIAIDPLSRYTYMKAQAGEEFCLKGIEGRKNGQLTHSRELPISYQPFKTETSGLWYIDQKHSSVLPSVIKWNRTSGIIRKEIQNKIINPTVYPHLCAY